MIFHRLLFFGKCSFLRHLLQYDHPHKVYTEAHVLSSRQAVGQHLKIKMDVWTIAAIVTMPLDLVLQNFVPLAASCLIGIVVTVFGIWFLSQRFMTEDPVEKAMGPMGMMTGDFITGVLLLKMVDPEMRSSALPDFSLAYTINTFLFISGSKGDSLIVSSWESIAFIPALSDRRIYQALESTALATGEINDTIGMMKAF